MLYGRLEDDKPFSTVRRLVMYEDHMLRLLHDADLPTPAPYALVEITPEREYLIVMEFCAGAQEIGESPLDDQELDGVLRSSVSCGTPESPTATSSRPTCWSGTDRCCSSTSPSPASASR